ncbi:C-type mannose receptor 2-like [Gambusia affinis]|uniref:C-type mannose receptor 2-like n=1 Tax=Gambusia affinis TaxID=33528 RepID=UPI001CDC5B3E|nr:C-type mannose receptor 2-like [Gambusia affinis]
MMKNLPGSWIFLLLGTSFTFSLESVLERSYRYSVYPTSWENARDICRRHYTDLATVYSEADVQNQNLGRYYAWIGLNGSGTTWSDLVLSDGKGYYLNFLPNPNLAYSKECVAASYHVWRDDSKLLINRIYGLNCGSDFFFICQDNRPYNGNGYQTREYIFVPEAKSWAEAQRYCNENNGELANINGFNLYNNVHSEDFPIWIGLYRDGGSWKWTESPSDYKSWKINEPSSNGDCVFMSSKTFNMAAQNCDKQFPFLCVSDNVFLVKENRSWEEALEHCRGLGSSSYSDLSYDLLSLQPGEEHAYLQGKVLEADTEEVWTGLRFLAGDWLWVNGADMLYTDLPSCPAPGQHCGALSTNETVGVKTRDCLERKNFLCYGYTSEH